MARFDRFRDRDRFRAAKLLGSRPAIPTNSTFADMQAERDWLRDCVIPERQERLRE